MQMKSFWLHRRFSMKNLFSIQGMQTLQLSHHTTRTAHFITPPFMLNGIIILNHRRRKFLTAMV